MITTEEVKRLTEHLMRTPLTEEERKGLLPTKDQLKVVIAFLRASEACKSVKSTEKVDMIIPKRAVCIENEFSKYYPEVVRWAESNPMDFEELYRRIYWRVIKPV